MNRIKLQNLMDQLTQRRHLNNNMYGAFKNLLFTIMMIPIRSQLFLFNISSPMPPFYKLLFGTGAGLGLTSALLMFTITTNPLIILPLVVILPIIGHAMENHYRANKQKDPSYNKPSGLGLAYGWITGVLLSFSITSIISLPAMIGGAIASPMPLIILMVGMLGAILGEKIESHYFTKSTEKLSLGSPTNNNSHPSKNFYSYDQQESRIQKKSSVDDDSKHIEKTSIHVT
jgi:xanthosine utilization system XapX-like protein